MGKQNLKDRGGVGKGKLRKLKEPCYPLRVTHHGLLKNEGAEALIKWGCGFGIWGSFSQPPIKFIDFRI